MSIPRSLYKTNQSKPLAKFRLPITEFTYNPDTGKFYRYGQEWKRAGVDAVVGPVLHEGKLVKATAWLKLYGERR